MGFDVMSLNDPFIEFYGGFELTIDDSIAREVKRISDSWNQRAVNAQ